MEKSTTVRYQRCSLILQTPLTQPERLPTLLQQQRKVPRAILPTAHCPVRMAVM